MTHEEEQPPTQEEIKSLDRLGNLLIEAGELKIVTGHLEGPEQPNMDWVESRRALLTDAIYHQLKYRPGNLEELATREKARVAAAAGMMAVMPREGEPNYDPEFEDRTMQIMKRGADILTAILVNDKELSQIVSESQPQVEEAAVAQPEPAAEAEPPAEPKPEPEPEKPEQPAEEPKPEDDAKEEEPAEPEPEKPAPEPEPKPEPAKPKPEKKAEEKPKGEAKKAPETEPKGPFIQIDIDGNLAIDSQLVELQPVSRHIFEYALDANKPFTNKEIYNSKEFIKLARDTGQTSIPSTVFNNAFVSLGRNLNKVGLGLDDFMPVVGGGPRSRQFVLNPEIRIEDKRVLARVDDLAAFLLDKMDPGKSTDAVKAAAKFFGVKVLTARHKPALNQAIESLQQVLEDSVTKVEHDGNGVISLEGKAQEPPKSEPKPQPTPEAQPPRRDRGSFVRISIDSIEWRKEKIEFTPNEKPLVAELIAKGIRGVTKGRMENILAGIDKDAPFDEVFAELKDKLGGQLSKIEERGRARYKLKTRRPKA